MKKTSFFFKLGALFLVFFPYHNVWANSQVLIPEGEFKMGTEKGTQAEKPVHSVWIDAFYLDRLEVTNKDFEKYDPNFQRSQASNCDDCPATRITWQEATKYCHSLGKRLPTEAEWEKARRGPNDSDINPVKEKNRFGLSFVAGTAPAQSSSKNGYGLHHMAGNVWEWTQDWFDEKYYNNSPEKNPQGPEKGLRKVVRGGSWYNDVWYLQAGMRFRIAPDVKLNSLGFRCAKNHQ
ncbi:MAG: SUMF1/EgtB/PvdO family nonheme iron enzyme [Nitrospinota bacterium]